MVIVLFNEFVQIKAVDTEIFYYSRKTWTIWNNLPHQFKTNAEVIPEIKIFQHMDNVVRPVFIFFPEMVQNSDFYESLVVKPLFVPYDFDGYVLVSHVIKCANNLPKAAFSNYLQYFISVGNVIVQNLNKSFPLITIHDICMKWR